VTAITAREPFELVVIYRTDAYAKRVSFCVAQGGSYPPERWTHARPVLRQNSIQLFSTECDIVTF